MTKLTNSALFQFTKWIWVPVPWVYLAGLQFISGAAFSLHSFALQTAFTTAVILLAGWPRVIPDGKGKVRLNTGWPVLLAILGICLGVLLWQESQLAGWVGLAAFFALGLGLLDGIGGARLSWRWGIAAIILAGWSSLLPVLLNQSGTRFSEEEFFVAVQLGMLFFYWLLLAAAHQALRPALRSGFPHPQGWPAGAWWAIRPWPWLGLAALGTSAFLWISLRGYQASFYDPNPPQYAGISAEAPFLCGESPVQPGSVDSRSVFNQFIQSVAAMEEKQAPEEGLLFLATGDERWAQAFHDHLLIEAGQGLYTTPANSVKFDQYLAALRVYTYARVRQRQPALFTAEEQEQIASWFHAVNRRALTVEWVDWMYGAAFSMLPEGPYENQENGAGLIALLEAEKLADPALTARNQDYLARNPRGWNQRFRNSDDALIYETEWSNNAIFQAQYTRNADPQKVKNSYLWVLLQMLPDGRAPQYNFPAPYTMATTLLAGAQHTQEGALLWLAGKALENSKNSDLALIFQAGTEQPFGLAGQSPRQGSCLLYGDSGLPNQSAGLAPDKVVLREGWEGDDAYLLLNLRFTGWHRYKGTNTVTLFDQGGPLIDEQITGQDFAWLPKGRSLFRDKRIPRENLNGFQIPRQGLDAVLFHLAGAGASPWSQDPPFYASVDEFRAEAGRDASQTRLAGWHGWQQTRRILFDHQGVTVIIDDASGPQDQRGAVTWHIQTPGAASPGRYPLLGGQKPAEIVLLPGENGQVEARPEPGASDPSSQSVLYTGPANGRLRLVTVLLTGDWVGANLNLAQAGSSSRLEIERSGKMLAFDLDLTGN